eukprot:gnl/MRDRNA2_/MRDRNA2_83403_c0_seq4.p1 gnl/MRDRNA2_/MRDRNA2_83403_c0~~gnl/MRDRNA2_/MRDRNA2_83403_c0_seq4.p1  ORF type:complete len:497 (-),score=117.88 gnl/MRDRNA2_/MRDRNA2_83403_c0_seq4:134-1507(-)
MDAMHEDHDKLMQFAQSTREFLDGFIDESAKNDKKAKGQQSLRNTLTMIKDDVQAKAIEALKEADVLIHKDIDELRKNDEDMRTKLVTCQDAEKENRGNCVQLKSELQSVADNLKSTADAQAATNTKVDSHKSLLDTEIKKNEELAQEQKYLRDKFTALNDEITEKLKLLNEQLAENQLQLNKYHKEFEEARDASTQSLLGVKDELGLAQKETQAKLDGINTDLGSQISVLDKTCKDLDSNLSSQIRTQCQQQKEDMTHVRKHLVNLDAITGKHKGEIAALQTAMEGLPGRVDRLDKEAGYAFKRNERLEKVLGLEPMTEEELDPSRGLKKRASTLMLSDDMLARKAWSAWMEAMKDAKNTKNANAIPDIQEMLKKHNSLIESEKSKLHSTNDRVQSLEMDHTKLEQELRNLRRSRDLNEGHWKGMARGLQVANKTMHTELKELPRLPGSRPVSSMS